MIGLLWWDSSGRPFEEKVAAAVARAQARLGGPVVGCECNPADVPAGVAEVAGVPVVGRENVLRFHFLAVVERGGEQSEPRQLGMFGEGIR